jgi:hypothetical protein
LEDAGVSKLIRFDEDHYGYLTDHDLRPEIAEQMGKFFTNAYPGKRLIIMEADEFIDLTGQYEILPIPSDSTVEAHGLVDQMVLETNP